MKNYYPENRVVAALCLLAAFFIPQQLLQAQITATWSGAGGDENWSTIGNWDVQPVVGDSLVFTGNTRLVNNNDIADMPTNAWLRFDSTGFVLNGNPLFLTQGITNSLGTNTIAMNLNWGAGAGQNVFVAPDSELVIAGTLTNTLVNHTNTGGGRVRITGAYLQSVNPPATVLNNIEYVIDGGTFTSAGGVRIASGTTPSSSKMILTNGAVMTQTLSGGAVRVGDLAGITGELIMHNSTFLHSGGEIGIGFSANAIGVVKQFGGVVSNVNLHVSRGATVTASYEMVGGVLAPLVIREQTGSGTSYISFDGSTLMPASGTTSNAVFFEGLNTAEIKSGGLTIDNAGVDLTISQVFTGAGRITKVNSGAGLLSLASASSYDGLTVQAGSAFINGNNTFPGGVIVNAGTLQVGVNANALGQSLLTLNGGTFRPNSGTRTVTIPVTIGGNVTLSTGTLVFTNSTFTLTGNRTLTVNNTVNLYSVINETGGSQALTKAGTGTLVLFNANTYSGTTTINNGTVRVLNATGSATGSGSVIVGGTGTLTGTGQVGAISIDSGGTVAPGTGVGILAVTNSATFGAAGVYQVEMSDANTALPPGTGVDFLNIPGALDITATSGSPFVIDVSSMAGSAANFDNTQSNSWIIATAGGINEFEANKFVVVTTNFQNSLGASAFSVSKSGNNLLLTLSAAPTQQPTIDSNIVGAGTTNAQISFSTVSGTQYTVQYKTNLNQLGWLDLTNFTATASSSTVTDNADPVPTERYYRVISP